MPIDLKRRFVDFYVNHIRKRAARHADKVREMQAEASRQEEQVIRFDVFSDDVRQRGLIPQDIYTYVVRVERTGHITMLPETTPHDVRILTDVPTLWAFASGYAYTDDGGSGGGRGSRRKIEPFTPRDAFAWVAWKQTGRGPPSAT